NTTMSNDSAAIQLSRLLDVMRENVQHFHDLLKEEQQAIRTLSFGQFSDVTERKSCLLDTIRDLEQERRRLTGVLDQDGEQLSGDLQSKEEGLIEIIGATDRMNRLNASLIAQSLAFLQGSLSLWQRSPASAPLYSETGSVVDAVPQSVGIKG
ncbi:MAG TPA: flagellar protein FlgN, partial [Nitrospiraceae bacterium]|nr:flagellar protein FlgN [Nitrospiraceae bacterium]